MKRLTAGFSFLLVSLSSGCGQQLVEFGNAVATPGADMSVAVADLSASPDLAQTPDLAADMAVTRDQSVDAMPDLMPDLMVDLMSDLKLPPPGPLTACAAMLGPEAQSFAVLGGVSVTNTGMNTTIAGNVGVSPGNTVIGIPNGQPTGGSIHKADPLAMQAQMEVTASYTCMQAAVCNKELTGMDLGGMTLAPGAYCFSSSAALTGNLVFDANGDPNAIWFIQIMTTLDLANNAQVKVINGGSNCNVFWQVGSSVTLGTNAVLVGNMLSLSSITMKTGASVSGRALARNGAVTLDTNAITKCN